MLRGYKFAVSEEYIASIFRGEEGRKWNSTFPETVGKYYQTTRRNIPKDGNLHRSDDSKAGIFIGRLQTYTRVTSVSIIAVNAARR